MACNLNESTYKSFESDLAVIGNKITQLTIECTERDLKIHSLVQEKLQMEKKIEEREDAIKLHKNELSELKEKLISLETKVRNRRIIEFAILGISILTFIIIIL